MMAQPAEHWDLAHERGETTRSWFEHEPAQSLRMINAVGISPQSIIDIGGGSSRLADALIKCGWSDITVLDVSETALQTAQRRLGEAVDKVTWISHDLLAWVPERRYRLWHDRAAFHFFTEATQRDQYRRALTGATAVGSIAIIGCFALDGPDRCSGLPVARYSPAGIANEFGRNWLLVGVDREEHRTPAVASSLSRGRPCAVRRENSVEPPTVGHLRRACLDGTTRADSPHDRAPLQHGRTFRVVWLALTRRIG